MDDNPVGSNPVEGSLVGSNPVEGSPVGSTQRISYAPLEAMDDEMRAEMDRCQREAATKESGDYWAKH